MKLAVALLALFALPACQKHPVMADPKVSSFLSSLLDYRLQFEPPQEGGEAYFYATLTNVSSQKLSVQVNDKAFHAALIIHSKTGETRQVFGTEYYRLLTTTLWQEPVVELSPAEMLSWRVLLSELTETTGAPVTFESLRGCDILSRMTVAIVPDHGTYSSDNASQESNVIVIPENESGPRD